MDRVLSAVRWLFDSEGGPSDRLISRWLFLRALGKIYFSAFFSLVFQKGAVCATQESDRTTSLALA